MKLRKKLRYQLFSDVAVHFCTNRTSPFSWSAEYFHCETCDMMWPVNFLLESYGAIPSCKNALRRKTCRYYWNYKHASPWSWYRWYAATDEKWNAKCKWNMSRYYLIRMLIGSFFFSRSVGALGIVGEFNITRPSSLKPKRILFTRNDNLVILHII